MSSYDRDLARAYYLPEAIDRAEKKLAKLYAEYHGISGELICTNPKFFHLAWEMALQKAKIDAAKLEQEARDVT